jgi:biopolymer transport protein ExbD
MRYFLIFLVLAVTGCSGQTTSDQQTKIDTAKLFNPNGHPDNAGAKDMNMFKKAIAVVTGGYAIMLNDKETDFETLGEAETFIISNKEEIKKDLFYILMMNPADFKTTVSVINILKKNQITDYKVIDVQLYFTPPKPVTIEIPTSVVTTYHENDSTSFSIEIFDKGINVKLRGNESKFKATSDLDTFVSTHKQNIEKIIIRISKELPDNKFKSVIEVLKKHGFTKFNLISK